MRRRAADPHLGVIAVFIVSAIALHLLFLTGGSALIYYGGGLGLAEAWTDRVQVDDTLEIDVDPSQVVDIPRPDQERDPGKSRYRSEWNAKVDRETQAKIKSLEPIAIASLRPPAQSESLRPPEEKIVPVPPGTVFVPPGHTPLDMRRPSAAPAPGASGEKSPPASTAWNRRLTLKDLRPGDGALGKGLPSTFPDYLKDVEEGEGTFLNTKEWKFASFFNRVKRAVAQHWNPAREYERRDPNGNVYGYKNHFTVLLIVLSPDGSLAKIVLDRPSGLTFLDEEAIRAFRVAAPFPNPPRRLVDAKTNQITFRFGFIFEVSRSPSFRLFRMN